MSDKSMMDSILSDLEAHGSEWNESDVRKLVERAFEAGKADQSDPLAGYSNLTVAIKDNEPIDWEKLDDRVVQCVNPDMETRRGKMEYNKTRPATRATSWLCENVNNLYAMSFVGGWSGVEGWTLWIEGDIPLRPKTADQLKPGTYFRGMSPTRDEFTVCVGEVAACGQVSIHFTPTMLQSPFKASEWSVLEEYGPFPFPDTQ